MFFGSFAQSEYPARQIKIKFLNSSNTVELDLQTLEKNFIKIKSIETVTPYDTGIVKFEVIELAEILKFYYPKKDYKKITITATDGYSQNITKEELRAHIPFLAFKANQEYMTTKNRGTFRIVFNYGGKLDVEKKSMDPKWVWSIKEISILE